MLRLTLKSLFAHKIRFALTTFAVVVGVAFVVGSFVLTDSVRAQFNQLFEDINADIDLTVRGEQQFEQGTFEGATIPIPETLLPEVRGVDGIRAAEPTVGGLGALAIDASGEAVRPSGGPPLGFNWVPDEALNTLILIDGSPPASDDEIVMDRDLAEKGDFSIGDTVRYSTPLGSAEYQLVGTASFGESNALAGATVTAFTLAEAQRIFNLQGQLQTIEVSLEPDADIDQVQTDLETVLAEREDGQNVEVVQSTEVVEENQESFGDIVDIFGNVLLGFAGVTLFVSAFLISNTFTIVVGQRVRELALLRAIGATERQVAASVLLEALAVGLLASIVGFGLGILTAMALNAVINATGFGAGETGLVLQPRSLLAAVTVGVVVTMLAALLPAWRATTVPPVAAMRDGFSLRHASIRTRTILGSVMTVLGIVLLAFALFGSPATAGLVGGMIVGALLIFLGIAALSPLFAAPVSKAIGATFRRLFRTPGRLAQENAARSPRRTASTAAALMIGLALVSMATVVATSVRNTFIDTLGTSITADWYIDTGSFFGFSPEVVSSIGELPEISAVTGGRFGAFQVEKSTKQFTAVDYDVIDEMFDVDLQSGDFSSDSPGVALGTDPAEDLGVRPGDTVEVLFNTTGTQELPVVAVYDDTAVLGNWVIDQQTYEDNFTERTDFWAAAVTAPDASADEARAAIETVTDDFPELQVLDRDEFKADREQQLNQFLIIINVFLLLAIVIAFLGIMNTLALSVFERTRELGLLRAVGMTTRQVRRMVRLEAVIVAVFGALLGVVVGVGFGAAISSALPDDFVSSIAFPVPTLIVLVLLAALLGIIAAIWPAFRAGRLNILQAISFE